MKTNTFKNKFVARIPDELEEGVLYICLECNVVVHLCACGCGETVVLPLAPEHWHIKYDGEGVFLNPSIGNTYFPCRSHYYISNSKVKWLDKMQPKDTIDNLRSKKKRFLSWISEIFK